jgi:hypothetical protein
MASNLAKRLDRLERLAGDLLNQNQGPVYCREGNEPEGIDPERLVIIKRQYVAPPERDAIDLPPVEPSGDLFGADTKKPVSFSRVVPYPNIGVA